jgi:hypothetical protein
MSFCIFNQQRHRADWTLNTATSPIFNVSGNLKDSTLFELDGINNSTMTDRYKITQDILALADTSPMNYVDIADIISNATDELQFSEQSSARMIIKNLLKELESDGEIEYHKQQASELTTSIGGQYNGNNLLVRSTSKRQKELEAKKQQQPTYSANFNAPFTGNFNQGDTTNQSQLLNEENEESKELTRKQLDDFPKNIWYRRQGFIWLIIAMLIATALSLWQLLK